MDITGIFEKMVEHSADNIGRSEDDYIGENGLIYCGKCHTPKQIITGFQGREFRPMVHCECQKAALKREEDARRERERIEETERRRKDCFPDRRLMRWSFANSDNSDDPALKSVKKYCDNFDELRRNGCGLILYGTVGVGKSYAAACAANELIDRGYRVYMTDFSRIINTLWGMGSGKQEYLDSLNGYDLLIIDDLAAERDTAYASEIVINVIDSRCKSGKPMIVTTNLIAEELFSPDGIRKQRIYSRLCEMCLPLQVTCGKDRRKAKMAENYARYRELLDINV